jgi:hypothetical protein
VEGKVKHLEEETASHKKERERRSVKDMEEKLNVAGRQIKMININFGQHLKDRKVIVERALEFMREDVQEKEELEEILKDANYFGTFQWPLEILDYVKGIKIEVRKMGYSEDRQYIRVRPESRKGTTQLRVDVKERKGGRFRTVAARKVPPMDKAYWERDIFYPVWCKKP